ncbi:MAG: hypothetical protein JOZ95_22155 [Solirubrobacterales bacterium]|nr:hypothetical protein [Solirubrobacterales bacterium]
MRASAGSGNGLAGVVRKRVLTPTLTVFLMLGGAAYARNVHPTTIRRRSSCACSRMGS